MHLTCNQLILLLQIYRGTLFGEFKIGTYLTDLQHLEAKGLIFREHGNADVECYNCGWTTTAAGYARVKEALQ